MLALPSLHRSPHLPVVPLRSARQPLYVCYYYQSRHATIASIHLCPHTHTLRPSPIRGRPSAVCYYYHCCHHYLDYAQQEATNLTPELVESLQTLNAAEIRLDAPIGDSEDSQLVERFITEEAAEPEIEVEGEAPATRRGATSGEHR